MFKPVVNDMKGNVDKLSKHVQCFPHLTVYLEDIIDQYKDKTPQSMVAFDALLWLTR